MWTLLKQKLFKNIKWQLIDRKIRLMDCQCLDIFSVFVENVRQVDICTARLVSSNDAPSCEYLPLSC